MDACQLLGRGQRASWSCSCLNWLFVLLLPAFEQDEKANELPEYSKFGQISVKGKAVSLPIGICFIVVSVLSQNPTLTVLHNGTVLMAVMAPCFGFVFWILPLNMRRTCAM